MTFIIDPSFNPIRVRPRVVGDKIKIEFNTSELGQFKFKIKMPIRSSFLSK